MQENRKTIHWGILCSLAVGLVLSLGLTGCPTPQKKTGLGPEPKTEFKWWENPKELQERGLVGYYVVVASATIEDNDIQEAQEDAKTAARGTLSQSIRSYVKTVYEKWVKGLKKVSMGSTEINTLSKKKDRYILATSKGAIEGIEFFPSKIVGKTYYLIARISLKSLHKSCKKQAKEVAQEANLDEQKGKALQRMDDLMAKNTKEHDSRTKLSFDSKSSTKIMISVNQSTNVNINR